jgi:5-methylcytosine-specific restriction endonuclease McrA
LLPAGNYVKNPAYNRASYQTNRRQVLVASEGRCSVAGCPRPATTADHVVPLAKGGAHDVANLRAMCRHHNSALGARLVNEIRAAKKLGRRSRRW